MSDVNATLSAIQEYVELAITRRRQGIPPDLRAQMEALEEQLRDEIEGARPAPKKIANPTAAGASPYASGPSAPSTPARPSTPAGAAGAASSTSISDFVDQMELSSSDQKKLNEISVEDLPQSTYTPPAYASFMADYYSDSIVPAKLTDAEQPKAVVSPTGDLMQLDQEIRILFGMERPRPQTPAPAPAARAASGRAASSRATSSAQAPDANQVQGTPSIVHLIAGGAKRGLIAEFERNSGQVLLHPKKAGSPESIPLAGVLAIFFGVNREAAPSQPDGQSLVVTLVNERKVSGRSSDYAEGATSLTLVPDPRRGNIDRIWLPATAVKEIRSS